MLVATVRPWELVHDRLKSEGWNVGWAEYEDASQQSVWLVKANRANESELADGESLAEAFGKLYCLTR